MATHLKTARESARLVCIALILTALSASQGAHAQSTAREIFAPAHPDFSMEALVGGSLAPAGRAWLADVHLELDELPVSVGLRGAFFRCAGCSDLDGDPDDDHSATATAHVAYSRPNYAIGGSLNFALGYELDTRREIAAVGGGVWLRLGRLDGIRANIGLSALGGGHQFASFGSGASLRIPVFANTLVRVWLEGRAEVVLPSPVVIFLSGALRARIGRVVVGVHALNNRKRTSLLLSLGVRLSSSHGAPPEAPL